MTPIPKRRYYIILIVLMVVGVVAFTAVLFYVRAVDREAAERDMELNTRYAYDGCIERNELRSVILTILEGNVAQPLPRDATPETRAYRQLLRSYIDSRELRPIDCLAIIREAA